MAISLTGNHSCTNAPFCHATIYVLQSTHSEIDKKMCQVTLPSSRKVNRPIWGNSLNVSRQMSPPTTSRRTMAIWSCLTKRGRTRFFSPVFLSIKQIKAWKGQINNWDESAVESFTFPLANPLRAPSNGSEFLFWHIFPISYTVRCLYQLVRVGAASCGQWLPSNVTSSITSLEAEKPISNFTRLGVKCFMKFKVPSITVRLAQSEPKTSKHFALNSARIRIKWGL